MGRMRQDVQAWSRKAFGDIAVEKAKPVETRARKITDPYRKAGLPTD
jgi:hypothetical protein